MTKVFTPDSRLASNTAGVLGADPDSVVITKRHTSGVNTYYVATVGQKSYACSINGGNLLTYGMMTAPRCNPINN